MKPIKTFILRGSLITVVLIYLLTPFKNQVFTTFHTISHVIENLLKPRHSHKVAHAHNFHKHQHDHEHAHASNQAHEHTTLSLLASFLSLEDHNNPDKALITFSFLDKHYPSHIHSLIHLLELNKQEENWRLTIHYFSKYLAIVVPPPKRTQTTVHSI